MGTITAPKSKRPAKHLQVSEQTFNSYLKQDSTGNRIYGPGTGRDAARPNPVPPTRPPGHNTIGTGAKFEDTKWGPAAAEEEDG